MRVRTGGLLPQAPKRLITVAPESRLRKCIKAVARGGGFSGL